MKTTTTNEILAEVWKAKDALSARFGHSLADTCRAIYTEQNAHPERFVNLRTRQKAEALSKRGGNLPP
jgi:hypothetical protein